MKLLALMAAVSIPALSYELGLVSMTFTPTELNTLLIGVVSLVTALGVAIPLIVSAFRNIGKQIAESKVETLAKIDTVNAKVESAVAVVDTVVTKVDKAAQDTEAVGKQNEVIKHLVDGTASEQRAEIRMMRDQITQLIAMNQKQEQVAAVLAANVVQPVTLAPPTTQGAEASLQQIETHTAATAENTKRTDDTVNALTEEKRDQ